MIQIHMFVHGRVQGVGFRYNLRKRAAALALRGYVRNLADGQVEVLAQGLQESIDRFVSYIRSNPGFSYVVKLDINREEPLNDLQDFHIRF